MRKLLILVALLVCAPFAHANEAWRGWCELGNQSMVTSGINSTTKAQQSFPLCTVAVFVHGGPLATIYADNSNTPLANPFQAQLNGQWIFYAANGRYDIQTSGPGFIATTYFDVLLCDPFAPNSTCNNAGGGGHNLLSTMHLDTMPFSPPVRGDLITAQNQTSPSGVTPAWARLPIGSINQVLTSNGADIIWATPSAIGVVTSFSSGNLSPLFTTSVATPTSTPALSFTLSNAAANTVFGNNTGSPAPPVYYTLTTAQTPAQLSFRVCMIDNDTQSATALVTGQLTGRCEIPAASTIVEVDVWGGTGTTTPTYTGASSINLTRQTPNGGATATILSGVLATPNSGANMNMACARTTTSHACFNGLTSSNSVTISTTSLSAGDAIYPSSMTADGVQTFYTIAVLFTVN